MKLRGSNQLQTIIVRVLELFKIKNNKIKFKIMNL